MCRNPGCGRSAVRPVGDPATIHAFCPSCADHLVRVGRLPLLLHRLPTSREVPTGVPALLSTPRERPVVALAGSPGG